MRTRVFLSAMFCCLIAPGAAGAATILGPADPNPEPQETQAVNWPSGSTAFTAAAPPGVQLTAPSDGVITSWRLYTDDTYPESGVRLRTIAPLGPNTFVVTGADRVEPLPVISAAGDLEHNVLHTFSSRLPIASGEIVGVTLLRAASGSGIIPVLPIGNGWAYACVNGGCVEAADGSAFTPFQFSTGQWLAMNATLEADADGDGFGDETQDACVGACLPSPTPVNNVFPVPIGPPAAAPRKRCKKGQRLTKRGKCVKRRKAAKR
jgi:hypothetical protein